MMRLFLFVLSFAAVSLSLTTDLCSNEIIIEKTHVNTQYSLHVFDFKVNITLRITQNIFNAKGQLVKSHAADFQHTVLIDKKTLSDLLWKPFTSIDQCDIYIASSTNRGPNIGKLDANYVATSGVPIVREIKLNSKITSGRYLEKGHDCKILEDRFEFLEGKVVSPFLPTSRSIIIVLGDKYEWNLLPVEQKVRGYSTTEVNELNDQYNFGRFTLIK